MFLKSLTLKGFKSFADPAVLEFEPGVTVVVGPNGSGKSNVVDAVAWVLGAQGPRTVRSAKMEDVIFMGTANRPALGRAEVSLTIDNSAGKLSTDLAELTITRTLFRSGDSEYAINGTPCRLLDIQELLSDTGVGRQQHVIISQGNLDAVLEARPEDRRAVIEEAAGVLKHRRRRERAERRLAATEENLERLYDLVREVKRQIRPLERQAEAARSHAGLAAELQAVTLFVAGTELRALDDRMAAGRAQRDELRAREAALGTSLTELDADSERTAGELSARRESDLAASLGRAEGLVERGRGLTRVLRERQRSLAQALDAAADADVVSTLEAEGAHLGAELEATAAEVAALHPRQQEAAAAEAEAAAQVQAHLAAWGDGAELRAATEAVTVARGQQSALGHSLERDRQALEQLSARLATVERRGAALEGEDHELAERLAEHEQARHPLQTVVAETEAALAGASHRLEVAEEALRQGEQELHRSQARADALETALEEARGAAGAELLADLSGVVGTLLDVVDVDPGWEDAFEAAAGASLTAVVVAGSEPARRALARLRAEGVNGLVLAVSGGRATSPPDHAVPPGSVPVRAHVRARGGVTDRDAVEGLLDGLLGSAFCAQGGWSSAIDLALSRPDLVVVTRDGDRFSSAGWRVRAGGGVVTAAMVEDARDRADRARQLADEAAAARDGARNQVEEARRAAADAVRADDRNEVAAETIRTARRRLAADRAPLAGELEDLRRDRSEVEDRLARDQTRLDEVEARLPGLEATRAGAEARQAASGEERRRLEGVAADAAAARAELDAEAAGLAERARVLAQRLGEVERRLTGHAEERQEAAARRQRLEADDRAVERLAGIVAAVQEELDAALGTLRERHRRQLEAVRAGGERLEALRRRRAEEEHELAAARGRLQKTEVDLVEAEVRRESVVEGLRRELSLGPEVALAAPRPDLPEGTDPATRVEELEARLTALGPVNPLALEELEERAERHRFLEEQVEDVRAARRELHQVIRTLDEEILRVFDAAFADVNEHFSNLISNLFPGGTGRLSLTDPANLLETGVEVEVRPAGRNVRRLSLLSGGERSLVAMAYLFAVFRSRPSPFYLMDEVEAALDDVNLQRFLGLVEEFRDEAQLIIVSHQKRTMEAADALYGVTMAPGQSSRVVSQKVERQRPGPLSSTPTADLPAPVGAVARPPAATGGPEPEGASPLEGGPGTETGR